MSLTESADLRARSTDQPAMNDAGALPPFPEGWYFVASRESILREKLIEKTWLGVEMDWATLSLQSTRKPSI